MTDIIERAKKAGDFLHLEDGFLYFYPTGRGAMSAHVLRQIADYLDAQNKEWKEQVERDLNKFSSVFTGEES